MCMGKYRDFKGVMIPKEIWLSKDLSPIEKMIFTEIHNLDNEDGCWASNRHFANLFSLSERQVRTHIGSIQSKGLIRTKLKNRNKRTIRCLGRYARVSDDNLHKLEEIQEIRESLVESMQMNKG